MAEVSNTSKYVAEAVGTFTLVFAVGCNVLSHAPAEFAVLSIASTLMVMIYAFCNISGGHFNPAVSFAIWLSDSKFTALDMTFYMLSQFVGGLLGACAYFAFFGAAPALAPKTHWFQAGDCEFHYTFMLVFAVLNCALAKHNANTEFAPLAIAFSVVAGGYASGNISGGVFNPAVGLALDTVSAGLGFGWCFVYMLFEFAGAALAALLYRMVHPEEFNQEGEKGLVAKVISEFLGTYMLVFTVGLNITMGASPAAAVLSIAASLMVMIYSLGSVSGANFNPAVTLAIKMSGRDKISSSDAAYYILTQLAAGVLAGLSAVGATGKAGSLGPAPGHGWAGIFVAESIFTFVLAMTVLCVATTREASKNMFGLAIGFCVVVGGYAIGSVSGGHLNPAVSWGVATGAATWNHVPFWFCLAYMGCQAAGSLLAAGCFYLTHATEFSEKDAYYSQA